MAFRIFKSSLEEENIPTSSVLLIKIYFYCAQTERKCEKDEFLLPHLEYLTAKILMLD